MAADKSPVWKPRRTVWYGLALMLFLTAAPHLLRLQPLVVVVWLMLVGWRLYAGLRQRQPPGLPVKVALIALAVAALLAQYGTLLGREAGSGLLVMMLALKFLELRRRRDGAVLVYLAYFLLAVQFLYTQQIPAALYLVGTALVITAVWIEFSDPLGGRPIRQTVKLAGRLLLQAVPLMLVLFFLFPRIPGPLWSLPHDAHTGMTGLGNEMEPGKISNLVHSDAIAFRVTFDGDPPQPASRYWRGPVFEVTDGRRWVPAVVPESAPVHRAEMTVQPRGEAIHQTITLEPHGERSLLALELPGHAVAGATLRPDFQLVAKDKVRERRRYTVTSYPSLRIDRTDAEELARTRQLPAMTSARVRALAQRWREQADSPRTLVEQALLYFNREEFIYTLRPPLLLRDPVDQFLFESRRGFCEHYASSFVILMRAAGLSARVVTGYLGGEFNDVGEYMIVRQSDAHAWAEVWLPESGWTRFDPTAYVAPERIERGIDIAPLREGEPIQFRVPGEDRLWALQRRAALYWDAVNNGWNQFVLGYDQGLQVKLLQGLGIPDVRWSDMALLLAIGAALAAGGNLLWVLYRPQGRRDPVQQLYATLLRKLARRGIRLRAAEGPLSLSRRVEQELPPDQAVRAVRAIAEYVRLRYAEEELASINTLRKLVAAV